MRAPATTFEMVEAWALREPARVAIVEEDSELTYGQLYAMLAGCGRELQRLGLRPGERVAVAGPGFARQLVMLLAAEALGAVTASFQAEDDPDAAFLFTQVQWVCAAAPQVVPEGVRFVLADDAFIARTLQAGDAAMPSWVVPDLDALHRISRTSGSSGASKFMPLKRRTQEQWLRISTDHPGFGTSPRVLMLGPLVINACFTRSSASLRYGGVLLVGNGRDIARLAPTHIWGLPLQIERLLAALPPGWHASQPMPVATFGGSVSAALRARIQSVFGCRIVNRYGSNEVGMISEDLDAEATGVLAPGVDLRILDAQGGELPPGAAGIVAVRTPSMAEGYLGRPEETAAVFRDGWYITGDVGVLVGRRRLRLLGRGDDLVNVGGIKLPAQGIEEALRRQPAIADAAVLAVQLQGVTLGIALVLAPEASEQEARGQLEAALRLPHPTHAKVVFAAELPRLATGKLDRMALLRLFSRG